MRSLSVALSISVVSFGALSGCSSLTPADDPVYLRLNDLESRLMRIERVVNNESLIQLAGEIEQLRAETQALRGEVETLRFETESASGRQRELYLDIDERLQALEQGQGRGALPAIPGQDDLEGVPLGGDALPGGGGPSGAAAPSGSSAQTQGAQAVSGSDEENYDAAFELIEAGRYEDAAAALARFLESFPRSTLADNAQYWLGEMRFVQQDFEGALVEFERVVDQYPQSDKTADALLKVGYTNYELRRWNDARTALQRVMRDFPNTTAARLAAERLQRIEQEAG